jgi:hypothetical protein
MLFVLLRGHGFALVQFCGTKVILKRTNDISNCNLSPFLLEMIYLGFSIVHESGAMYFRST